MRILVCTPHMPFPPRGGGRADIWRRVVALTRLGHEVMLVHQHEPTGPRAPSPEQFAEMDRVLTARFSYPIKRSRVRTLRQLAGMWRLPWNVAKTVPTGKDRIGMDAAVREFRPQLILLEGPWQAETGRRYAGEFNASIAYRSHNVEHLYLKRQAQASTNRRNRVAWRLATVGLKQYELRTMRAARLVLDISLDDMEFWRARGVQRISWLPPLPELALSDPPNDTVPCQVLFVGGLRFPNNVHGVRWLIHDVLPVLQESHPDVEIAIVGSTPDADLRAELAANAAVRTYFDVESVNPYLFGATVLVNPVSIGSGVQLKMLDMLMTDAPIVSRSTGARGFPLDCVREFRIADTRQDFASAILQALHSPGIDLAQRQRARDLFTLSSVERALSELDPPEL